MIQHSLWSNQGLPDITEQTLIYFVAFCSNRGLRFDTIKQYLSGIRYFYIQNNRTCLLTSPDKLCRLQIILRGVKKSQCNVTKPRLPITYNILKRMLFILSKGYLGQFNSRMLSAACSLAFFGFLRCGELTVNDQNSSSLSICDVQFNDDKSMFILVLKNSKSDVFRKGVHVPIHANKTLECPVRLLNEYIQLRLNAGAQLSDPLFINDKGLSLHRNFFITNIKSILKQIGLDSEAYSGHSFRIGAATTAAKVQVPDHLVKTLGRWSSDCYLRYIRTDVNTIARAQRQMCNSSDDKEAL